MTKEELIQMLRGVGCDENTITAMSNAYDLGLEFARGELLALPLVTAAGDQMTNQQLAKALAYVLAQIAIKEAQKK